MANVLQHHIDFHTRPVSHAPSPFGFGFGLGSASAVPLMTSPGWHPTTPGHTNSAAFQQLASSLNQASLTRPQKRRHEADDESDNSRNSRDDSMDRSPTPDRPKRAAPKKARVAPSPKDDPTMKENKVPGNSGDDDVDIGLLLASLPSQSLLPLLNSLLKAHPSLRSTILPLIPRPTLETALQALTQSAKKLRDAYPYSNSPSVSAPSSAFGFGRSHNQSTIVQQNMTHSGNGNMRDSYVLSRLRPHIAEFVAACMSYLPYFTCIPSPQSQSGFSQSNPTNPQSASAIHSMHKDKFHPSETFLFLSAVTSHLISQPPLAQSLLLPALLPRVAEEWRMWIDKIDEVVNQQGGMFGVETVRTWERRLDEMAEAKFCDDSSVMRTIRDRWVTKVGWLVGRSSHHPMDEL